MVIALYLLDQFPLMIGGPSPATPAAEFRTLHWEPVPPKVGFIIFDLLTSGPLMNHYLSGTVTFLGAPYIIRGGGYALGRADSRCSRGEVPRTIQL